MYILSFELFENLNVLNDNKYKSSLSQDEIINHLKGRGMKNPNSERAIMIGEGVVFFVCYSLSGKIVGFQRYIPDGVKNTSKEDTSKPLKYLTIKNSNEDLIVWGLHTYKINSPYLFVVEGVWDAYTLHLLGYPAIAVLSNDPSPLKSWLNTLSQTKIAICDNDVNNSGKKLIKFCDKSALTEGSKDLNDLYVGSGLNAVKKFIDKVLNDNML